MEGRLSKLPSSKKCSCRVFPQEIRTIERRILSIVEKLHGNTVPDPRSDTKCYVVNEGPDKL